MQQSTKLWWAAFAGAIVLVSMAIAAPNQQQFSQGEAQPIKTTIAAATPARG